MLLFICFLCLKNNFVIIFAFFYSCKRGFEGKNCEIESIGSWFSDNDVKNFPAELKQLYDKLNSNGKQQHRKQR